MGRVKLELVAMEGHWQQHAGLRCHGMSRASTGESAELNGLNYPALFKIHDKILASRISKELK